MSMRPRTGRLDRLECGETTQLDATGALLDAVPDTIPPSDARRELVRRRARSPRQVAEELAQIWAATDPSRRPSTRRKDLLDIERIIESHPNLRSRVPDAILAEFEP